MTTTGKSITVACRFAKEAFFRGAKGDTCFRTDPYVAVRVTGVILLQAVRQATEPTRLQNIAALPKFRSGLEMSRGWKCRFVERMGTTARVFPATALAFCNPAPQDAIPRR